MAIPKAMQGKFDEISAILNDYCDNYLDEEYKELCIRALEKLCRKRPSPLNSGRAKTWAAGIIHAIGSANFLFDKDQPIHMTAKELAAPLGVAASTASAKATEIKRLLKISYFSVEWCLPSQMGDNPLVWMIEVNGLPVDVRYCSKEFQELCYRRGLIPYVPGEKA